MKKPEQEQDEQESGAGAGTATTRAGECHFQAALPESKQISLLKRVCRSPCGKPLAFRSQVQETLEAA